MADRGDRLLVRVEVLDEGDGVLVGPEQVGVDLPAGNDERVILVDADRIDGAVDLDRVAPIVVVPAPDLARLKRHDVDHGTGFLEPLLRHEKLRLLEAVGRENHDAFVGKVGHGWHLLD